MRSGRSETPDEPHFTHRIPRPPCWRRIYTEDQSRPATQNGANPDGTQRLAKAFQADIIVERTILLELKTVEHILPLHEAQTRTYLRLSNCQLALLINFNGVLLKDGIRRFIP